MYTPPPSSGEGDTEAGCLSEGNTRLDMPNPYQLPSTPPTFSSAGATKL